MLHLAPMGLWGGGTLTFLVSYSARFNDDDSAFLSWTPSGSGDSLTTATLEFWFRLGNLGINRVLFDADGTYEYIVLRDTDQIQVSFGSIGRLRTTQVLRDPSAIYHLILRYDTTQATASDRIRLYINGVQVTAFDIENPPGLNATFSRLNQANPHYIGKRGAVPPEHFDGVIYKAAMYDGMSYGPADLGETDANGFWNPIDTSGLTFGTNGFLLDFSNALHFGEDQSGNGNNFTDSGFTTSDQLLDSPTDSAGDGLGNYATLDPIGSYGSNTFADGNLDATGGSPSSTLATIPFPTSGQWGVEVTFVSGGTAEYPVIGIVPVDNGDYSSPIRAGGTGYGYGADGSKFTPSANSSYGATFTHNDVIELLFDADTGTLAFKKNGTSQGNLVTGLTGQWKLCIDHHLSSRVQVDFGQLGYSPSEAGYQTLHTGNMPAPGAGSTPMTGSFTGNASADGPVVWLGFTPDTSGISTINGNTITWGTDADALAGGFKLRTSSLSYNASGLNSYSIDVLTTSEGGAVQGAGSDVAQGRAR